MKPFHSNSTRGKRALLSALALAAAAASAQTAQTAQTAPAENAKQPATLPEVKVQEAAAAPVYAGGHVATRARLGLLGGKDFMETPFSTIAYTESFMEDSQAGDVSEVIARNDPAVFASGAPGESNESYTIRGLPSLVADVMLNGLPGMAAYFRNAPEMLERVEVLKGPSALLNGMPPKGTTGGAVNLVPKRAGSEPLARVKAIYQSDSHFGSHVDVGRRLGEQQQFGVRFNGVWRNGETAVNTQRKKATLASLGLDWRGAGGRARVSADLYRTQDRVKGMTRGLTLAPGLAVPAPPRPDVSWNPPWAYYDSVDKGAMLRGEFDWGQNLTAWAAAGASHTAFDTLMGIGQVINAAGDMRLNFGGVADTARRCSAEAGLKGRLHTGVVGHQLALQLTHYSENYRLNGAMGLLPGGWTTSLYHPAWGPQVALPSPAPAITRTDTRLSSIGAADTLSFMQERLQITLGARRQQVKSATFSGASGAQLGARYSQSATTPSVAILYKAGSRISLYANYAEGLSQGAIAPATAANAGQAFPPFKTRQKEAGLKLDLGEFAHTFSVFEIRRPGSYTDLLTNFFSFGGMQRNRGVEWGFFGQARPGLRLMGGLAWTQAKVIHAAQAAHEGRQATGVPRWQAKLGVEWDAGTAWPAAQGLTLTAHAAAASRQYLSADNALSIPGRAVIDLGARYATRVAGRPFTLRAALSNAANRAYWTKPYFASLAMGEPRTLRLSATMDF